MSRPDTTPYWQSTAPAQTYPPLDRDLVVDVIIVGGGQTGVTAAYLLTRAGRRVAVLERATCGAIDTGHTTAHLTCVTDARLSELVSAFGEDHARATWDAGLAAIAAIDTHVRTESIRCAFAWVPGYLHASADSGRRGEEIAELQREATLARDFGFDAQYLDEVPWVRRPGVRIDAQARFHPRAYIAGLAAAVEAQGRAIFECTSAEEISDDPLCVTANGHTVRGQYLILATHNPLTGNASVARATLFQTKLALYTSYAVAALIERGSVPDALWWDTADPYRYLRLDRQADEDVVVYGGEDHKTGQEVDTLACFARLEAGLAALIPDASVTHRWSGQVIESPDGLPYIGETAPRQFVATAFGGNGMTFGTLGAMMACDAALGRPNPWRELFDVDRVKVRGGLWDYLTENRDYPYYMIRDRFAGPDGRSFREIRRGQGKLIDIDGERIAAYRHPDGSVSARSAVCTHMGCGVQWNLAEQTWDCPCHGSRFTVEGEVIAGPAEAPLPPAVLQKDGTASKK